MKAFRQNTLKNLLQAQAKGQWSNIHIPRANQKIPKEASVLPGAGIGPELTNSVLEVFKAANVPVKFQEHKDFDFNNPEHIKELNRVVLLGCPPRQNKINKFAQHYKFYQNLGIFAKIVSAYSLPNIPMRHQGVDCVIIRERSEGEYSGIEHEVYPGVVESIKLTTSSASRKIAEYAFNFAYLSGRKKVTAVHKANIMKMVDGCFLTECRAVAKQFPHIQYEEMIVDNCSMQLVKTPNQFDVMLMPNLYGTLCSNIASGITGGNGMQPGVQIGDNYSIFSQGNMHPAVDIAGKDICNPTGILLSSCQLLRHMDLPQFADQITEAITTTLKEGKTRTQDIGGTSTRTQYVNEIINNLK
ncbi:hypothetical protein PPERSA_09106 [Pseudocohnilembus persalinus]|uniref:Isopropylmalate dehydrogenase-like domain-containing protein n=1 Tax=Pseudocohnilembus persalinus TaxID=266149 RepID=A0A0V0QXF7_PSEPJ|nr:hypothetical protein PPERSA_09106 [Pseudocohnilembus persalinus]|eukprot:KRX06704.1 hypothetical protein PPERSA_09106 [Pseudocohnilembus persalinus]